MKKTYFYYFLMISFHCMAASGFESLLNLNKEINFAPEHTDWPTFLVSTEMPFKGAKPFLMNKAPKGLFISVGTERAWHGASITQNATHILLIDYDSKIIRFNQINKELLKAKLLKDYRYLRWEADWNAWRQFIEKNMQYKISLNQDDFEWWKNNARDLKKVGNLRMEYINRFGKDIYYENFLKIHSVLSQYEKKIYFSSDFSEWKNADIHLSKEDWEWWDTYITKSHPTMNMIGKEQLEKPVLAFDLTTFMDLKSENYLFNEKLYQHLHQIAIKNQIAICQLDIRNKNHLEKMLAAIKKSNIKISVADFDNIYMSGYVGDTSAYDELVRLLPPLGTPKAILFAMTPTGTPKEAFFGFTFENIQHWPKSFSINTLVNETFEVGMLAMLSGQLYEKQNLPKWLLVKASHEGLSE